MIYAADQGKTPGARGQPIACGVIGIAGDTGTPTPTSIVPR